MYVSGTFEFDILKVMADLLDVDLVAMDTRMRIGIVHWFTLCLDVWCGEERQVCLGREPIRFRQPCMSYVAWKIAIT